MDAGLLLHRDDESNDSVSLFSFVQVFTFLPVSFFPSCFLRCLVACSSFALVYPLTSRLISQRPHPRVQYFPFSTSLCPPPFSPLSPAHSQSRLQLQLLASKIGASVAPSTPAGNVACRIYVGSLTYELTEEVLKVRKSLLCLVSRCLVVIVGFGGVYTAAVCLVIPPSAPRQKNLFIPCFLPALTLDRFSAFSLVSLFISFSSSPSLLFSSLL